MSKGNFLKLFLAGVFLLITIVFTVLDNEIIFPSSMVAFLLVLTFIGGKTTLFFRNASRWAIICFSALIIILNILVPLFLPAVLSGVDFTRHNLEMTADIGTNSPEALKNHFIQVTNNDMHELCFATSILLIFYLIFLVIFNLHPASNQIKN